MGLKNFWLSTKISATGSPQTIFLLTNFTFAPIILII